MHPPSWAEERVLVPAWSGNPQAKLERASQSLDLADYLMTGESWGSGGRSWERGENIPSLQESLDQSPAVSLDRSGGEHGYQAPPIRERSVSVEVSSL